MQKFKRGNVVKLLHGHLIHTSSGIIDIFPEYVGKKALIEYSVLGIIAYIFIRQNNKTTSLMQDEYKKLVDNLIKTQDKTLRDLEKAIHNLTDFIKFGCVIKKSNFRESDD